MAFLPAPHLPTYRPQRHRTPICANYLLPAALQVDFSSVIRNGNFGAVFFGLYNDPNSQTSPTQIVVKCPVQSTLGRELYTMEKYTNIKLQNNSPRPKRFAQYVGEVIIPPEQPVAAGLVRLGLVWRREGSGDTLESYLSSAKISQLASVLGTVAAPISLRRSLAARLIRELALMLKDIQSCGFVHRDIKPSNILVVPQDADGVPLKAIDFGSSCDWSSLFKKGLSLATCDPVYTAPERRLQLFKPAFPFDMYSIALIALRVALPSLTDESAMTNFVNNGLNKCKFSFQRTCSAILGGRIKMPPGVVADIQALTAPACEDMYALFATLLTENPEDRANVDDCLTSRFVRSALSYVV